LKMSTQSGNEETDRMTGRTIGPYNIEVELGRGGMATVYRARHTVLGRSVALKILLPTLAQDPDCVERFLTEARAASSLDHPHIVPIYDCGDVDGVNFIAMKLLEGRDLRSLLQHERRDGRGKMPLDRAAGIVAQAADALAFAHAHGVVHRDIKPGNIYVGPDDWVTIVDFGIAWALESSALTLAGTSIGTPAYMSPDQAMGREPDGRSDVYSLGVVFYEMLSGVRPFTGDQTSVMYAHVHTVPAPIVEARPDIPAAVSEVLDRALAKDPNDRFQTADEFSSALATVAGLPAPEARQRGAETLHDDPTLVGARVETPVKGSGAVREALTKRRFYLAGAGLLLIAIALIGVVLTGRFIGESGRLSVESNPSGATVTIDGRVAGETPIEAQQLSAGTHEVQIDKPTYQPVRERIQVGAGRSQALRTTLPPAAAIDLLQVKAATAATGVSQDAGGRILASSEADSIGGDEPFALILSVAQKQPGIRDVAFRCQVELFSPSGTRLSGSDPVTITIPKDDAAEHSCAGRVTLPSSAPAGIYQGRFYIDGAEAAPPHPIQLLK
jgi:serine/threonine-protein kinase